MSAKEKNKIITAILKSLAIDIRNIKDTYKSYQRENKNNSSLHSDLMDAKQAFNYLIHIQSKLRNKTVIRAYSPKINPLDKEYIDSLLANVYEKHEIENFYHIHKDMAKEYLKPLKISL